MKTYFDKLALEAVGKKKYTVSQRVILILKQSITNIFSLNKHISTNKDNDIKFTKSTKAGT